jgi:RHS repeat-associated protein
LKHNSRKAVSLAIISFLILSNFVVLSRLIKPCKAYVPPYASTYINSGLIPYGMYQFGSDDVQTPGRRQYPSDNTYIAAKGDLTIKETDLSIPGRCLDLTIERVYTTPAIFENNEPYGYETPPVDVGKGWTLNFPWIGNLLHLWDGTCYEIKWSGNSFENHKGAHFKLVKQADNTYILYKPSGTTYNFDSSGKLKTIVDKNGNTITFSYEGSLMKNITDTVGRVAYLSYTDNRLSRISYDTITIDYSYSNGALTSVKDAGGRHSYYEYYSNTNHWLISKAKYPEGGYKTYTYTSFSAEGDGVTYYKYKIASEKRYESDSNPVNVKEFEYVGNFSVITSSSATIKDGNGAKKVKHYFAINSDGLTESFTVLDIAKAQTQEYSESHSDTHWGLAGTGYWEDEYFHALYVDPDGELGYLQVGPFEHHPNTTGYTYYETSLSGPHSARTITVTTHWLVTTVPQLKKTLYTYNSRNEVTKEDVYVGNTDDLSYSIYRRYDNWGNLIYSKDAVGQEKSYSYSNTDNSGVFVGHDGSPKAIFSNLFYSCTVPSNIHSALLGEAELQDNGTTIETYKQYDTDGNSIKARRLRGEPTSFVEFCGTFDESGTTNFSIDLTGIDFQGNTVLGIQGLPKVNYQEQSEVRYATSGMGFTGGGYWQGKCFKAYYRFFAGGELEEGYISVGPFTHYPGTSGYKRYTTWVPGNKGNITVTTFYDVPFDRYPAKVEYHFNSNEWKTITENAGANSRVCSIPPSELVAGLNTLYFRESSSYTTKFSWKLYVPIYADSLEDLTTYYSYDDYGNLISIADAEGMETRFEFGAEYGHAYCTKVIKTLDEQNITASMTYYFAKGLMASEIDPNGCVTSYEYDNLRRRTKITNPDGSKQTTLYDDTNNTVTHYDELNHKVKEYFDGLRRTIKIERYLTHAFPYSAETFIYNYLDKPSSRTVPHQPGSQNPPAYRTEYDAQGRVTKSLNPDGSFTKIEYEDINNTVAIIDEEGHKKELEYDWASQLLTVKEYINESSYYLTRYEYDHIGNLIKVIDARNQTTTCEYHSLFGISKIIYADSTNEQFFYDKVGNPARRVDRNGDNTTYIYDDIHRLVEMIFADATNKSFAYDNCSRMISISSAYCSSAFTYDCRGRIVQAVNVISNAGGDSYVAQFTYDAAGRLTKTTYPNGLEVFYEYDNLNRLERVHGNNITYATFSHNFDNTVSSITYGNGLQTTYTYDSRLRPLEMLTKDPNHGNLTLLSLNFTYDKLGNIIQLANGRRTPSGEWKEDTETYAYDWLNRLVSAQGGFGNIEYTYDAVGNRLTKTENDTMTACQYDVCNRLVAIQTESKNVTLAYDPNGNLATKTDGNETWTYIYTKEKQLQQVINGDVLGLYTYDGKGRRVYQAEGMKTTVTIYSGLDPIFEHTTRSANQTVRAFIYGSMGRIAARSGDQIVYYHSDHLRSVRLITNASANAIATMSYEPFGQKYEAFGVEESVGFAGKEEDSQVGLYYFGARNYDPEIGRFIQTDACVGVPEDPQSQNRYSYCKNNPLRYVDPTGNTSENATSTEEKAKKIQEIITSMSDESDTLDLLDLLDDLGYEVDEQLLEALVDVLDTLGIEVSDKFLVTIGSGAAREFATAALSVVLIGLEAGLTAAEDHPEFCAAGVAEAVFLAAVNMAIQGALNFVPGGSLVSLAFGDEIFDLTHDFWVWLEGAISDLVEEASNTPYDPMSGYMGLNTHW